MFLAQRSAYELVLEFFLPVESDGARDMALCISSARFRLKLVCSLFSYNTGEVSFYALSVEHLFWRAIASKRRAWRLPQRAEKGAHVADQQFGLLPCGEMAAARHMCPALHAQEAFPQFAWRQGQIFGEGSNPRWNFSVLPCLEPWRGVGVLVVQASGGRDRLCHPIDHYMAKQFVFAETLFHIATAVAPCAELLHEPAGQANGRVIQGVGDRLWPG